MITILLRGGFDDDNFVTTAGCFGEGKTGGRMCIPRSFDTIKSFEPLPAALRLFQTPFNPAFCACWSWSSVIRLNCSGVKCTC